MGYRDIVSDSAIRAAYNAYQDRYRDTLKESDKVLLSLVADALEGRENASLLDIGCSTGNLLGHLSRAFPDVEIAGCDLAPSSAEEARKALPAIRIDVADMLALPYKAEFDIAIASAVTVYLTPDEYRLALSNVAKALKPGGVYIAFEWLCDQDLEVVERAPDYPDGLRFYFRPFGFVSDALRQCGFAAPEFRPFAMPFDLPKPTEPETTPTSYTVRTEGERLCFRGGLFQPWCHLVARLR